MAEELLTHHIGRPLRILHVISNADLGGAQVHLSILLKGCANSVEPVCAYGDPGRAVNLFKQQGARTVHILGLGRQGAWYRSFAAGFQVFRIVRTFKPDIIHAHSSKAGLISRIVGYIARVSVVYTAHGWGFKPGAPRLRRLVLWLSEMVCVPLTSKIIAVSMYDYHLGARWLPGAGRKLRLVRNGLPDLCGVHGRSAASPIITMVARFREPKRQDLLLCAFAGLKHNAKLCFIGDGPEQGRIRRLATDLGLTDEVEFVGEQVDVLPLLSRSAMFALISDYEGMPISIIEAMRAGLPVVASKVGGVPEQVDHLRTGLLVRNDIKEIGLALSRLLQDTCLRERMGAEGRRKFLAEYGDKEMLERTKEVYTEVLADLESQN